LVARCVTRPMRGHISQARIETDPLPNRCCHDRRFEAPQRADQIDSTPETKARRKLLSLAWGSQPTKTERIGPAIAVFRVFLGEAAV
jgi:hypothetical protein